MKLPSESGASQSLSLNKLASAWCKMEKVHTKVGQNRKTVRMKGIPRRRYTQKLPEEAVKMVWLWMDGDYGENINSFNLL